MITESRHLHAVKVLKMLKLKNLFFMLPLLCMGLASCNVHEWPKEEGEKYAFTLYLDFDMALPLYKEVYYTRGANDDSRADESLYDIRYIINVYRVTDENDNSRYIDYTYTFSKPYIEDHDYSVVLDLPEGNYRFRVWSDHVATGTQTDYFYNTADFTEIKLDESNGHPGSNERRDAFRGTAYGQVYDPELYEDRNGVLPANKVVVPMERPMGRYEFVSTDLDDFLDKAIQSADQDLLADLLARAASRAPTKDAIYNGLTRDELAEAIGLDDYTVVFSYNAFMPSSYNLYTDKPSDSSTGIKFDSKMEIGTDGMKMGFDYILVDEGTTMNVNMHVYNGSGDLVSAVSGVEVPVVRSKNTVVKGLFLTVTSGGGVTIDPDFEGPDFDIEIH